MSSTNEAVIFPKTYTHLWTACNTLLSTAPSISRHLGASLIASIPPDGISSFASRMHCTKCGALMTHAKVRIQKGARRCAYNNRVRRTCRICGKVNVHGAVKKGGKDREKVAAIVEELRSEIHGSRANNRERNKSPKGTAAAKSQEEKKTGASDHQKMLASSGRKRKRKRSMDRESHWNRSQGEKRGIATSFLFEPL